VGAGKSVGKEGEVGILAAGCWMAGVGARGVEKQEVVRYGVVGGVVLFVGRASQALLARGRLAGAGSLGCGR